MRLRTLLPASALLLLLGVSGGDAAPFVPKMNGDDVENYKDFLFGLQETRDNMNSVQCGGFDPDSEIEIVGENPATFRCKDGTEGTGCVPIPNISPDLPGRDNVMPLKNGTFGIGQRGEFMYPETAYGFMSACDINLKTFNDPDIGEYDVNPEGWCLGDKRTPYWCRKLFDQFKQWHDEKGEIETRTTYPDAQVCEQALCPTVITPKSYCWDFTEICFGSNCETVEPSGEPLQPNHWDKWPQNCDRKDPPTGPDDEEYDCNMIHTGSPGRANQRMSSFYRHYAGPVESTAPLGVSVSMPNNEFTWSIRAECYGLYRKKDPKDFVTTEADEQCEIVIGTDDGGDNDPYQQSPKNPEWKDGEFEAGNPNRQREKTDPEVDTGEPPRGEARVVPEPWKADSITNLALLNMKQVKEVQRNFEDPADISGLVDATIPTKITASKTVPDHARNDGFDDTAERTFSIWWEKQQKVLLKALRDPTIKLIMPARFLTGLDQNDPLYRFSRRTLTKPVGAVEVTLNAGSEDFGNVAQSLRELLTMPVQEVRIPVVVPLVSEAELNTRLYEWQQWKKVNLAMAAQADPLIDKILQYRTAVRRVRLIREALPHQLTKVYSTQNELRAWFGDWYVQNAQLLVQYAQDSLERQKIRRVWRKITQVLLLADSCQLQWCQNQRFSQPVYSLLDGWFRSSPSSYTIDELDMTGIELPEQPDLSFDFSELGLTRSEMILPSLLPIMARVKVPIPPTVRGVVPVSVDEFPDLPMPPDPNVFDFLAPPAVITPADKRVISGYTSPDLSGIREKLMKFRTIVDGTPIEIQEEEEQREDAGEVFEPRFSMARNTMIGALCRFQFSVPIPPNASSFEEDETANGAKIVHIENELRERVARLWSRWLPNRKEDFAGRTVRLADEYTENGDKKPPCREGVPCISLPDEFVTKGVWQLFAPTIKADINNAADKMKDLTKPKSQAENPYQDFPIDTIDRFFPKVDYPIVIDIIPPAGSN